MRQFLVVILSALYLFTTTGANFHLHYCMGKLSDWSVFDHQELKTCGECGMEKNGESDNNCCKDEMKLIKIEDDQKGNSFFTQFTDLSPQENCIHQPENTLPLQIALSNIIHGSHAPPGGSEPSVYLLNCNFRL